MREALLSFFRVNVVYGNSNHNRFIDAHTKIIASIKARETLIP